MGSILIRAKTLLTMLDEPLSPGFVRIHDSRISEIGDHLQLMDGEEFIDLKDHVLLPGLINAHCHLDYTGLRGSIFPGKSFTQWIKNINGIKSTLGIEDYARDTMRGFDMLIRSGCTTVLNIVSLPQVLGHLPPPPIRTWSFLELIDVRQKLADEELMAGAMQFFYGREDWLGGFGLSPHAPYTASVQLYRLAKRCAEQLDMLITTHIAESLDEQEMFLHGQGEMHQFLAGLGRDMSDCGSGSALSHLYEHALLNSHTIAVHMNYLQAYDLAELAVMPLHIVHCPKCHEFFKHRRFALEQLRATGCNICIGTDSLASNDTLDLRAEIRLAHLIYPQISSREWLAMVTLNPAKALNLPNRLGAIKVAAWADLVAFRLPEKTDPYDAVIRSTEPPEFLMVNGVRHTVPSEAP